MTRTGPLFIAGLWLVGAGLGLAISLRPGLWPTSVPVLVVPLLVALAVDVALLPIVRAGRVSPLTMNERALAVVGATLIALVLPVAFGSSPAR